MIKAEKTIERNVIYKGRVLEYVVDTVDIDGSCATREMVLHPGGVGVPGRYAVCRSAGQALHGVLP